MEIPKIEIPKKEIAKLPSINIKPKSKDTEETKAIKKLLRDNNYKVGSYSEFSTFNNCKYEYYLSYIQEWIDEKGNLRHGKRGKDNVYSKLGGIIHDVLEDFIKGKCTRQQMIDKFEFIYKDSKIPKVGATSILKFPSDKIEKNYIECIRIFLQNYQIPKADKILLETFLFDIMIPYKLALQGYADLILGFNDKNGKYAIIDDFKTSTKFKSGELLEKGRQLVMYAYMYTKRTGIPVKMVRWNMLKYYEVSFPNILPQLKNKSAKELKDFLEKNGVTEKLKKDEMISKCLQFDVNEFLDLNNNIIIYQKNELFEKVEKKLQELLIKCGLSEDSINYNLNILQQTYSFDYFTDDVKNILLKFNIFAKDYYLEYNLTQDIYDEMENYIISTYNEMQNIPDVKDDKNIDFYYPPIGDIDNDPFYCHNLCGHATDNNGEYICKYYKKYCENIKNS